VGCFFFSPELSTLVLLFATHQTKRYFLLGCYYQKETPTCDLSAEVSVCVCVFTTCCCTWNLVPPKLLIERTTLQKVRGKEFALCQGNQVSKNLRTGPIQHSITYIIQTKKRWFQSTVLMCLLSWGLSNFYQQLKCYPGNLEKDFTHGGIASIWVSLYPPSTRTCVTRWLEEPRV